MAHQLPVVPMHTSAAPMFVLDQQRAPGHQPGRLVYSAKFDHEKLKCLYCMLTCPFCCGTEQMARNTHLDIYTNATVLTRPGFWANTADCCFGRHAWGLTRYFDHPVYDDPVTGGPFCGGGCWTLCGYLGKFGGQVNHNMHGLNSCDTSGLGHILVLGCCTNIESIYGLTEDGEGARVAGIINEQVRLYRTNPTGYPLDVAVTSAPQMGMKPGTIAVITTTTAQPVPAM